ncbi:MAG: hypothetical protein ACLR8P_02685 [Clostridium fessum]
MREDLTGRPVWTPDRLPGDKTGRKAAAITGCAGVTAGKKKPWRSLI